jgi:hypothetical protein
MSRVRTSGVCGHDDLRIFGEERRGARAHSPALKPVFSRARFHHARVVGKAEQKFVARPARPSNDDGRTAAGAHGTAHEKRQQNALRRATPCSSLRCRSRRDPLARRSATMGPPALQHAVRPRVTPPHARPRRAFSRARFHHARSSRQSRYGRFAARPPGPANNDGRTTGPRSLNQAMTDGCAPLRGSARTPSLHPAPQHVAR